MWEAGKQMGWWELIQQDSELIQLHTCWGKGDRKDKGQETKKPREAPERELGTSEDIDEIG